MNYKNIVIFLSFTLLLFYSSFSLHIVSAYASTANGALLHIDNLRKAAGPNELVQFNTTVTNNKHTRENFIIRYVGGNCVLCFPINMMMGDDGQRVYDSSPFGNHGTLHNFDFNENSGWVNGKNEVGKTALSFNGVDDYVEVPDSDSLKPDGITIGMWVKRTMSGLAEMLLSKYGGDYKEYYLEFRSDDKLHFIIGDSSANPYALSTCAITDTDWHYVTATYDGENLRVYLDSTDVTSGSPTGGPMVHNTRSVTIGKASWFNGLQFKGLIDEVRIYNRALTADEIVWLYNGSWKENLSRYKVELELGENTQMTFDVKVPKGAKAGYIRKFLLTAFPQSDPKYTETKTVTVEVLDHYDVAVSLDENEKSGKLGDSINFDAVVRNWGNVEDTYDISAEGGEEWSLSLSAESITVSPRKTGTITISVTVPSEARPGDSVSFRVQAVSRGDPNLVEQVEGAAVATVIYDFSIMAHSELEQGSPGSEVTFPLELRKLGTTPDTFDLEIKNTVDWDVEVDPSSLSLENGEAGKVVVRVRVPEDALIGQVNRMTIQAVSRGDPGVSAESSISVEVVTPFWERPDVRFLVGLIIGVLVGATLIGSIILRKTPIIRKRSRKG